LKPNILYLHGLASSPSSKKATYFREQFADRAKVVVPDLNVPDFERLTLTAILAKAAETVRACPPGPVYLIGSSLGGLSALHFADRYREREAKRVEKLVLMAPALDFAENRARQYGADWLEKWQSAGSVLVYHYAYQKERPLHFGQAEDILEYDSYRVRVDIPILIFHGKHDQSVDYRQSIRFAEKYPNVTLHLLDSDHQLLDQTVFMRDEMTHFLGI
jgi:pimeloyl-ACP methyl ester carboxylesterase